MTVGDTSYRRFLPALNILRFKSMQQQDAHEYANDFKQNGNPPWLHALYLHWRNLFVEPFKGVTNNGRVRPDLFQIQDEGMPIDKIVTAAQLMLSQLTTEQRQLVLYHVDSPEWRSWSNPEFLLSDKGLRLDELDHMPELRDSILGVLRATLSPEGYAKALGAMRINGFLGQLVQAPRICNEFSYNFVLFGTPSTVQPWGFSFYGHHLCLNVFLYRTQVVISPWFTGAEPNIIDGDGPYAGTRILSVEEALGLRLMQSLPSHQQAQAQIYALLKDPAMPHGRWNHDDQRHLCGAYRDNRIVPYEGTLVSDMSQDQQAMILEIVEQYLLYLPVTARRIRTEHVRKWFHETYFCWIGGFGDNDAFYYRIQSPVIIIEFDHHSGVSIFGFKNSPDSPGYLMNTLLIVEMPC
jgi:hypothetical protein